MPPSCSASSPPPRGCCTNWTSGPLCARCCWIRQRDRRSRCRGWRACSAWCWTPAGQRRRGGPCCAQAYDLFRIRGTQACLERILRLYLPVPVAIVESWRLRGLAGAVLGAPARTAPAPAVGGPGAAGALGRFTVGGVRPGEDGYTVTAHRFTVLVCGDLDDEQRDVVHELLETHKPAHTMAEICELGPGMRVGRHLHVGLSSVVGPVTGWGRDRRRPGARRRGRRPRAARRRIARRDRPAPGG